MSDHLAIPCPSCRQSLRIILLTVLVSAGGVAGEPVVDLHQTASRLQLDTTLRRVGSAAGRPEIFRLEVPAPGILILDVSAPACDPSQPKLTFLGTGNASSDAADPGGRAQSFDLVRETPQGLVLDIRVPGSFFLAVSAEDPSRGLNGYKLHNTFVADVTPTAEGHRIATSPHVAPAIYSFEAYKDVEEEEDETDPDLIGPCPPSEADDHGDTPLCATPLRSGSATAGRIENGYGDDEDYFTFALDAQETVSIEITEGQSRHGALYDEKQQRLTSCDSRNPNDVRIVRTLGPGRYYVRIESSDGTEGPYRLRVEVLRSPVRPFRWWPPKHSSTR